MSVALPAADAARAKKTARAVQSRFAELGIDLQLGHAYEAVASVHGYNNWATMAAGISASPEQEPSAAWHDVGDVWPGLERRVAEVFDENIDCLSPEFAISMATAEFLDGTDDIVAVLAGNDLSKFPGRSMEKTDDLAGALRLVAETLVESRLRRPLAAHIASIARVPYIAAVRAQLAYVAGGDIERKLRDLQSLDTDWRATLAKADLTEVARFAKTYHSEYKRTVKKAAAFVSRLVFNEVAQTEGGKRAVELLDVLIRLDIDFTTSFVRDMLPEIMSA